MQPKQPINITTSNVSPTLTPPGVPPTQASQAPQQTSPITAARVAAAATTATAVTATYVAYLEYLKYENNLTTKQQDGLKEVFKICEKCPSYKNSSAIYTLQLSDVTDNQIIYCLKKAGRLDAKTRYNIINGEAVPFSKSNQQQKVTDLNNPKNPTVNQINQAGDSVISMREAGKKMVKKASGDNKVLINLQQERVEAVSSKALGNLEEAAVDAANPQIEETSDPVNSLVGNLDAVKFAAKERDVEAQTLLDEQKSETSI